MKAWSVGQTPTRPVCFQLCLDGCNGTGETPSPAIYLGSSLLACLLACLLVRMQSSMSGISTGYKRVLLAHHVRPAASIIGGTSRWQLWLEPQSLPPNFSFPLCLVFSFQTKRSRAPSPCETSTSFSRLAHEFRSLWGMPTATRSPAEGHGTKRGAGFCQFVAYAFKACAQLRASCG